MISYILDELNQIQLKLNMLVNEVKKYKETGSDVKKKSFGLVKLSDLEYSELTKRYSEKTIKDYISKLDNYIGATGRKYKSHYRVILMWLQKDNVKEVFKTSSLDYNKLEEEAVPMTQEQREQLSQLIGASFKKVL